MASFDIYQFEDRLTELLAAYEKLQARHRELESRHQALREQTSQRLLRSLAERLKALEAEAEAEVSDS